MRCERCGHDLARPGDHCLSCGHTATDAVLVQLTPERAVVIAMGGTQVIGERAIVTAGETADPAREVQRRNFVGRVIDEVRRKRPSAVYAAGDRTLVRRLRRGLAVEVRRLDGTDIVAAYRARIARPPIPIVERPPREKIGGSHSTVIGDRTGQRVLRLFTEHPHVKRVIPGPIEAGGGGSRGGIRAKVTRADAGGNLRALLRHGSSVQEVRLVTTAGTREDGERIADQLAEELAAEGLRR